VGAILEAAELIIPKHMVTCIVHPRAIAPHNYMTL